MLIFRVKILDSFIIVWYKRRTVFYRGCFYGKLANQILQKCEVMAARGMLGRQDYRNNIAPLLKQANRVYRTCFPADEHHGASGGVVTNRSIRRTAFRSWKSTH